MAVGKSKKSERKYHTDVEEFIPYAAHFDEETLITKNGELLQIIKLTGFEFEVEKNGKEEISLRSLIRQALQDTIKDDSYAFWIHTIRREADLAPEGEYKQKFPNDISEKWIDANKWRTQFVNELYITIVREGESFRLRSPKVVLENLFINMEFKLRNNALVESHKKLSEVTNRVVDALQNFGARKLSIYKKEGVYYSEMASLVSKVMNLEQEELPLAPCDLSSMLPTRTVSFQYNTIQVVSETKRHFGAIYTVKEYREVTLDELDKLIQLPVNMIIAQSFCFVEKKQALNEFKGQKKIYDLSGSKYMSEISGIDEIFDEKASDATGYGEQQIVIAVLDDTVKGLQGSVSAVVDRFREMGIIAAREDLFMETCYWSMMPANFDFLYRKSFLPIQKIAGFASLHNFTTGKLSNNLWGSAVTTLPTRDGLPYFFNFHFENNGHTVVVGEKEEKYNFTRFLILQAQKYDSQTIVIEHEKKSEVFVRALGGKYYNAEQAIGELGKRDLSTLGIHMQSLEVADILKVMEAVEREVDAQAPTIIYIDENITSISDETLIAGITEWEKKLIDKKAIVIFSAKENINKDTKGIFAKEVMDLIETKIFFPVEKADKSYKDIFGLSQEELDSLKTLSAEKYEMEIKRHNESVIVKFDCEPVRKTIASFSDTPEHIELMNEVMNEHGSELPERWMPSYHTKMKL